ncbi:hypothetical protein CBS63078_866 [Aspergillus niger]|uniref:histidine kinase n=3 Tax=Aspergillus niger TaxID=5061 RepID=A2R4Z3_ASPNC|nr:uncharacterized protein An15g02120 [Aspergillus niger]XP_025452307.1 uncharacterized protein BO96DRAFT_414112 [Aspergillus niger CBS 101883]RDH22485.1 hypothetical protein M747DRAFT_294105 [Aspergillus niger ATCC 13496]KAI2819397.1 hypothetical protein CBS115989_4494 [Aspergillus niger]KAI2855186.1 hypothetical protein CBS11232_4506 [Aspergillus niger]KAI2876256.1 hypothetical protein CBS115988_4762 [Aspergillus niger]KAI2890476.1 hypothetical protein CBS13152_5559 [Aspergillus niger]|eukprot:XP_001396751.1 two-component system protein A [Aspergillus niger CBS 513.88]
MFLDGHLAALSLEEKSATTHSVRVPDDDSPAVSPSLACIYRHTPIPTIVLDSSMTIVEVSDSHLALSGKTRQSMLHATVRDLDPTAVPAPNIAILCGALRAACSTKEIQVVERIVSSDKSLYNLRVTPIYNDFTLLYIVLEAHKLSVETASINHAYTNETYKILVDTVKEYAIFMLDTQGNITTWNPGAAIMKGWPAEEILGRHFSVFYSPEDRLAGKPLRGLAVCLREGRMEDEGWRYRRDGSRFWANVLITPIYQFGQHVGFVKVTRDLSERKEAEARIIAAFEESSRLKTDFLANISHEIRTPMNGMKIAMTMLADTGLSATQREHAAIIQDSMSLLLETVNDVLDYSKLSSGSFSLHSDVVDVNDVVGAVIRNCRPSLKSGVELTTDIAPDFPRNLRGDPLRYRQILQNLVGNAVKFTESGHIRVSTVCSPDEQEEGCCLVRTEVTDTGIGVPDNALNTLFTPFTRFANSSTRQYQGTGLGLSICKSLAELMDGEVGYSPNPEGRGSVFWFTAKLGERSITTSLKPRSPVLTPVGDDLCDKMRAIAPHKHVLLVEDNMVNHTMMLKLLRSIGFTRVDGAWNGAEALSKIKKKPLSYNVVLMDVSMPIMDGLVATGHIRDMGLQMPIIAVTGNAMQGDAESYIAKGMSDCIGKPVHRDQLLSVLWKWIGS